jgi:hypothetical protein
MKNRKVIASLLVVAATCCFLFLRVVVQAAEHAKAEGAHDLVSRDNAGAAAAFEAIVPVLHHPRCMNCHSNGDFPRQGDDSHRHTMQIHRGPDGQARTLSDAALATKTTISLACTCRRERPIGICHLRRCR